MLVDNLHSANNQVDIYGVFCCSNHACPHFASYVLFWNVPMRTSSPSLEDPDEELWDLLTCHRSVTRLNLSCKLMFAYPSKVVFIFLCLYFSYQ